MSITHVGGSLISTKLTFVRILGAKAFKKVAKSFSRTEIFPILTLFKRKFRLITTAFRYGFALMDNKFDCLRIRVVAGTQPDGKIYDVKDLFPPMLLEDKKTLNNLTQILKVKPKKLSTGKPTQSLTSLQTFYVT